MVNKHGCNKKIINYASFLYKQIKEQNYISLIFIKSIFQKYFMKKIKKQNVLEKQINGLRNGVIHYFYNNNS